MRISDVIESFIKQLIKQEGGAVSIQRNSLAEQFNCVPSQINYVISTRFTNERGYTVESRRGGGGCIIIRAMELRGRSLLMHVINSIGERLDSDTARVYLINIREEGLITEREANIMSGALNDRVLPLEQRDEVRAALLKNMLAHLI